LQLTDQEQAIILAALNFWAEEIVPYGEAFAQPYFEAAGCGDQTPLTAAELQEFIHRIRNAAA